MPLITIIRIAVVLVFLYSLRGIALHARSQEARPGMLRLFFSGLIASPVFFAVFFSCDDRL